MYIFMIGKCVDMYEMVTSWIYNSLIALSHLFDESEGGPSGLEQVERGREESADRSDA